jgi:spore germination cell wall hydrolase CwlJ-like protein
MIETVLLCMSLNLYFEARGEEVQGQIAVAEVTLNRVASPAFPDDICGVVLQENENGCAYSWWCDGLSDKMSEGNSMKRAKAIAELMILEGEYISVVGKEATHYHATTIDPPYWAKEMEETARVGNHVFYKERKPDLSPLPRPKEISCLENSDDVYVEGVCKQ